MNEGEWLAERFEDAPAPAASRRLSDAGLHERGRRRCPGVVDPAQPLQRREIDNLRAWLPPSSDAWRRHAPLAQGAAGGAT